MHPLLSSLRDVDDDDLDTKINAIYDRLKRAGHNPSVYNQLMMILSNYQEEKSRRADEARKKLDDDDRYNDKIDIGR